MSSNRNIDVDMLKDSDAAVPQAGDDAVPNLRQRLVSSVTRRYPFLSGCASLPNSRLVRRMAGAGDGIAWARLDCGLELLVPLDDFVGRAAYFVGDLDRKLSGIIRRVVRPGDRVMDVGANIGIVSVQLAKLVGGSGVVHSFEPNPNLRDLLGRSLDRNGLKNVRVHPYALGDEEAEFTLSYAQGNFGSGTLTAPPPDQGWISVKVPVRTLSSLAEDIGLRDVRLVKVDVEGYEPQVFRGAKEWLASHPPDVFLVETNTGRDSGEDGILSLLAGFGYSLYSIPKSLCSLRLTPYKAGADAHSPSHDTVAIRRECEREITSLFRS